MVDHAVLHAQALHVLAADVEDELHAREHLLSAAQVRDRLDLARVDAQRLKKQRLAVAGDRGVSDGDERLARLGVDRHVVVELGDGGLRASEHVALVRHVMRPEQAAFLVDERRLERGRTRVDAQVGNARVIHEALALHALGGMALVELIELGVVCEQRRQAHDLGTLDIAQVLQAVKHVGELLSAHGRARRARDGAAACHEQVRVVGHDAVLLVEVERLIEAFTQFGKVLQRAAQKRHVAADGPAAREAGDGLRHDGLEDRRGDVLLARALVQKRLHVGLREHAAARGDRVDGGRVLRELVQAARIGVQKRRHLVDERARAARAGTVHALLDAVFEVDDLSVLAAELDGHVGFGDEGFDRGFARDDLLHELDAEPLSQKQSARAGDGDRHALIAEAFGGLGEHLHDRCAHVSVMTAVNRVLDLVVFVQDGKLHRRRADIDADMERVFHDGFSNRGRVNRRGAGRATLARACTKRRLLVRRQFLIVHVFVFHR